MTRLYVCDGPGCGKHRPQHWENGYHDWPDVTANEDADAGNFCSWTCLAAWATNRALEREAAVEGGETS